MPYPNPTDPAYCPGSRTADSVYVNGYYRCNHCERIVLRMGHTGLLFPHVVKGPRTRKFDQVHEILAADPISSFRVIRPNGEAG